MSIEIIQLLTTILLAVITVLIIPLVKYIVTIEKRLLKLEIEQKNILNNKGV